MTSKANGDAKPEPTGCTLLAVAFTLVVAIIGLVIIANYLSSLAGIR